MRRLATAIAISVALTAAACQQELPPAPTVPALTKAPTASPTAGVPTVSVVSTVPPTLPSTATPLRAATPTPPPPATNAPQPTPTPASPENRPSAEPAETATPSDHDPTTAPVVPLLYPALSDAERECLGPSITSDEEMFASVDESITPAASVVIDCLSPDNQFQLYLNMAQLDPDAQGLNLATHRCIWDALSALQHLDGELGIDGEPTPEEAMVIFGKMMMLMITVPVYCAATEQPKLFETDTDWERKDVESFTCMIDLAGGLDAWVQALFTEDEMFMSLMDLGELECPPDDSEARPAPSPAP